MIQIGQFAKKILHLEASYQSESLHSCIKLNVISYRKTLLQTLLLISLRFSAVRLVLTESKQTLCLSKEKKVNIVFESPETE